MPAAAALIRSLADVQADDVPSVGAQHAALATLGRAVAPLGACVPDGFVSTAAACARLREAGGTLPPDLHHAIRGAYRALAACGGGEDPEVSVRTRALAPAAHETTPSSDPTPSAVVRGADAVVTAVLAALDPSTPTATARATGSRPTPVSVSVIATVPRDRGATGTLYSVEPDSGFGGMAVVVACRGHDEVGAEATGEVDRYTVCTPLLDDPSLRPVVDVRAGAGPRRLGDDMVLRLARLATAAEQALGHAVRLEWIEVDGRIVVTDARPVSPPAAHRASAARGPGTTTLAPRQRSAGDPSDAPQTRTAVMLTIADPVAALRCWRLPCAGIGLARMEYLISELIRVHPMALVHAKRLDDHDARRAIADLTRHYADPSDYFVQRLARGIATMAASRYPGPVVVRTSDLRSDEYASLIGGSAFEPAEANPMLGLRGASRYDHDLYRDGFALECRAIRHVREVMGLRNVVVMLPFCRTLDEADRVVALMAEHGLERGRDGLQVHVMAEVPSNVLLVDDFASRFDGISIGSNDLTQLVLGVDRGSTLLAGRFDERDAAVRRAVTLLINGARRVGTPVGICGSAPASDPDFVDFLIEQGIDWISLEPDQVLATLPVIAAAEARHPAAAPRW